MSEEIRFYRASDKPHGVFSNLCRRIVVFEGEAFTQHADLAKILLDTGDAVLIESATVDNEVNRRWGQVQVGKGGTWVGENWLGKILMETRDTLRTAYREAGRLASERGSKASHVDAMLVLASKGGGP